MVEVLATVRAVFEPLREIDPNYEFVGEADPWVEVYDRPRRPPPGGGFIIIPVSPGERPQPRLEQQHGYRITLTMFGTSVGAQCESDEPADVVVWSLVDGIMDDLPAHLAQEGRDSAWPGCLSGHSHPPEFHTDSNSCTWVCPASGEIVQAIAMVP